MVLYGNGSIHQRPTTSYTMSLLPISFLLILLFGFVWLGVIFSCTLIKKIKAVRLFSVQGVNIQFHPQHTLEIE